ncbi:molybdopterin biosynthesis protein [Cetobacterium sp. 2A]|uniref:molybdopterin biosynthesis protein n=1 Tax=unclassified Cetobacterium TaxID=2630983 RepID=UPI00163C4F25|nr:molybdopterin biosynthesis protein [Cetobacterium sp. 2A]MBC2855129.1 molybdopterin biosynthesis protein [Cetobacterium sp. 2A]
MDSRNIYIDNIEVEKALEILFENIELKRYVEVISVIESVGKITSNPVFAKKSSPSYSASAMDGVLIFADKTSQASERNPIFLSEEKDFTYVNTGNPIDYKLGNCVIMIEELIPQGNGIFKIIKSAKPWQHIRPVGEDMIQGEMILKSNHKIMPQDLGALLSAGILEIEVYKKPTVAILPTGNEVIDILKEKYVENSIIDSNSYVFSSLIKVWGGEATILPKSKDDFEEIKKTVEIANQNFDIVIINAGSSAGSKDYTKQVIQSLGEVLVHGIAVKPGKPTILGKISDKPVIGIPGYPVSAYLSMEIFVKSLLEKIIGNYNEDTYVDATLSKTIVSSLKHKELVRIVLYYIDGKLMATPLSRGAGITTSLVKADGILEIPKNIEGIGSGEKVKIRLLKPLKEIRDYLVSVGSHDIVMDLISDRIKLTSTHVGSFGGIMALKNSNTHIAPIHILDENDGTYNISIVKKYFPNKEMSLIKGVGRIQGIMLSKGNPLGIKGIKDLVDKNINYINRQRGSGTRILLDYLLKQENISIDSIVGYEREAATHLEAAMAIKSGTADAGLGIMEAARIADLDFIPLKEEEYDFVLETKMLEDQKIIEFINLLKSEFFKNKLTGLDGYTGNKSGEIINLS